MSSCLQMNTLREYPFAHDSVALPVNAETKFENVGEDELAFLIIRVVQFYSQFFSKNWRDDQTSKKLFHAVPKNYPSQEQMNKFEGTLFELLIADYEKSTKNRPAWRCSLSTHYYPEKILNQACQAIGDEFAANLGVFFPMKSRMDLEYDLKKRELTVRWKGGSVW